MRAAEKTYILICIPEKVIHQTSQTSYGVINYIKIHPAEQQSRNNNIMIGSMHLYTLYKFCADLYSQIYKLIYEIIL
jgi:hypothetical protein